MRSLLLVMALGAPLLCAQEMVRATVDGNPVTQAQLESLINIVPDEAQRKALSADPEELLRFFGFITRMAEFADKDKLAEQSPYKEQLEMGRRYALAVAEMSEHGKGVQIPNAEIEKYYEDNKDSFTTANVTLAMIPIAGVAGAATAKSQAETIWKQLQAGGAFCAGAKQFPVGGDFKSFKKSDALPDEIKDAVFALKPGQITKPVVRPNGVFLIRLDSIVVKSLQDARGDVLKTIQDTRFQNWMNGVRKSVVIVK